MKSYFCSFRIVCYILLVMCMILMFLSVLPCDPVPSANKNIFLLINFCKRLQVLVENQYAFLRII